MIESPVFLVGSERSGTTMLRLMLDHHPRIAWLNEFEYAVDRVSDDGSQPALSDYYGWLQDHRVFQATGFTIDGSLDYAQLVSSFLEQRGRKRGAEIVGATCHRHFDRLLRIWPGARFIHLVRDGRDVARSCIAMGWAGNAWVAVERWIEAERLWERVAAAVPEARRIELKHEGLVESPRHELERLCAFMGVTYDEAMLRYDEGTTYEKPDPSLLHQWKRKMSPKAVRLVEGRAGDLLTARGYELSGLAPIRPSGFGWAWLRVSNRMSTWLFRRRRYGWRLTLESAIAKRVRGFEAWRSSVAQRLNAVDAAHLR